VTGILAAAGRDAYEASTNAYGNGIPWRLEPDELSAVAGTGRYQMNLSFSEAELRAHFAGAGELRGPAIMQATVTMHTATEGSVILALDDKSPAIFSAAGAALGAKSSLPGRLAITQNGADRICMLTFEPVHFVYLKKITNAAFEAAGTAVEIAIGLIGIMALWLGIMKVAEEAGLIALLARAVRPVTVRLFPDIPHDHPAVGAMLMNISANMLGLGNAATPFGLKAMEELNKVNPKAGTASNAMCTFLAMNTSCITLIPATAIAVRVAAGSANPAAIIGTTFLASLTATIVGVTAAKVLQRLPWYRMDRGEVQS
jgi:spore maturation protein A